MREQCATYSEHTKRVRLTRQGAEAGPPTTPKYRLMSHAAALSRAQPFPSDDLTHEILLRLQGPVFSVNSCKRSRS